MTRADKKPNINPMITKLLEETYGKKTTPEEIFYYVYAVLFSEVYRRKYAEFFKTSFPRVPFTKKQELFLEMSQLGNELSDLHLLKSEQLNNPIARLQGDGDHNVGKPSYDEPSLRVYVNKSQYFEGIRPEVWNYQIGGYQVMSQWLKDRKDRILSLEDIKQYCKVATSISKTIELQRTIDEIYEKIEQEVIKFEQNCAVSDLSNYS
jgi:predicted helicase